MHPFLRVVPSAALVCAIALSSNEVALAGGFRFAPAIVQLTARAHTGSVTITNPSEAPLRVEVQPFEWGQGRDGQPVLAETDELIAFPLLVVVPPKTSREIRLAILAPPTDSERTYHAAITEIPAFSTAASPAAGLTIHMRADIPVFYAPVHERSAGTLAAAAVHGGALQFTVANVGTVHFEAKNIRVVGLGAGMRELFVRNVGTEFVLAGGQREYRLELPRTECRTLRALMINLDADAQHLSQSLDVAPGDCGP